MGGGTVLTSKTTELSKGLSPRGRGEPYPITACAAAWTVYPRVGGGTRLRGVGVHAVQVYPRVGGGTGHLPPAPGCGRGLSPRGRGNLKGNQAGLGQQRSIPAWAGEPAVASPAGCGLGVYPRVGGGTARLCAYPSPECGLSPRGRGNLGAPVALRPGLGSIPAWAGEPQCRQRNPIPSTVYPRVGGGTLRGATSA